MLAQISLGQHGFILPLRIAESFVRKDISRFLRGRALAAEQQRGAEQNCTSLTLHRGKSPLYLL